MKALTFQDIEPLRQKPSLRYEVDLLERVDDCLGQPSLNIKALDPVIARHAEHTAVELARELQESLAEAYRNKQRGKYNGPLPDRGSRFRKRFLGDGLGRAVQAITVGSLADAWTSKGNLHIFDACGGSGMLSTSIAHLRAPHPTSGEVIDRNPKNCQKFPMIRDLLAPSSGLSVRISDVRHHALAHEGPSICVAKHACGPAAELILENVAHQEACLRPNKTVILTCCHGNLGEAQRPKSIKGGTWLELVRLADGTAGSPGHLPEKALTARFAMQLVDSIRVQALPDHLRGAVHIAFSPDVSVKNHALVVSNA